MPSGERPKIIGIGLVSLDIVMDAAGNHPVRTWAGGTCGNVLTILASLGWDAWPVARLDSHSAAQRMRADMARWGVRLDFTGCDPVLPTPVIVEQLHRRRDGTPAHRFGWRCPHCRHRLPRFRPVTLAAAAAVFPSLQDASAFFMDRVSPAALALATRAAAAGAVIVFEPSSPGDPTLFAAAIPIAHIIKYADQRLPAVAAAMRDNVATLLEVQTQGARGLRYRHRLNGTVSDWTHLDAIPASRLVDTCGAGDWCTAGLIAQAAATGLAGLRQAGDDGVRAALRHGQALAARNCEFAGARGGMYANDPQANEPTVIACPHCGCGVAATRGNLRAL